MPNYDFHCKKCDRVFEVSCRHEDVDKVKCCNKKAKRLWTLSGQVGDKRDNFGYMAEKNYEKATGERRAAEAALKKGERRPYRPIDDTNRGKRMNFID